MHLDRTYLPAPICREGIYQEELFSHFSTATNRKALTQEMTKILLPF
jgi:hypothetical protein